MKLEKNQIDALNLQVTLNISKEDYAEAEKKTLNERKKSAEFKGFRKGMAPMSLIQKYYGEQALLESVNKVISASLNDFIKDNKIRIVGEPLTSEDQPEIDWKSGNDFTFKFDIASTPEVDFEISKEDKIPYYNINITEQAKKEMKENMLKQAGSLKDGKSAKEEDFVIVDMSNGEKSVEGAYISVRNVAGDAHKLFVGTKPGDEFDVNVNEAFTDETDRASMLKVKKEELEGLNPVFHIKVVNVKTFVAAEESQEVYDKLFGKDVVHNSEEFEKAIADKLAENYKQEADYRLSKDMRDYFIKKADIALPEEFLKRWLYQTNEGKFTMEDIEKEFDAFLSDFRWQMTRSFIMNKYNLKIEEKDMQEAAEAYVTYQYAMYGMGNVPADLIRNSAQQVLSDEKQARNIGENVESQKVISALKENISLAPKKISVEKFRELK
ncbi:MAG: trigger factor [Candidatus Cryptobacteroides sp.]